MNANSLLRIRICANCSSRSNDWVFSVSNGPLKCSTVSRTAPCSCSTCIFAVHSNESNELVRPGVAIRSITSPELSLMLCGPWLSREFSCLEVYICFPFAWIEKVTPSPSLLLCRTLPSRITVSFWRAVYRRMTPKDESLVV